MRLKTTRALLTPGRAQEARLHQGGTEGIGKLALLASLLGTAVLTWSVLSSFPGAEAE